MAINKLLARLRKVIDTAEVETCEDAEETAAPVDGNEPSDINALITQLIAVAVRPDTDFKGGQSEKFETIRGMLEGASCTAAASPTEPVTESAEEEPVTESAEEEPVVESVEEEPAAPMIEPEKKPGVVMDVDMDQLKTLILQWLQEEKQEAAHNGGAEPVIDEDAPVDEDAVVDEDDEDAQVTDASEAYRSVSAVVGAFSVRRNGKNLTSDEIYRHGLRCILGRDCKVSDAKSAFTAARLMKGNYSQPVVFTDASSEDINKLHNAIKNIFRG